MHGSEIRNYSDPDIIFRWVLWPSLDSMASRYFVSHPTFLCSASVQTHITMCLKASRKVPRERVYLCGVHGLISFIIVASLLRFMGRMGWRGLRQFILYRNATSWHGMLSARVLSDDLNCLLESRASWSIFFLCLPCFIIDFECFVSARIITARWQFRSPDFCISILRCQRC